MSLLTITFDEDEYSQSDKRNPKNPPRPPPRQIRQTTFQCSGAKRPVPKRINTNSQNNPSQIKTPTPKSRPIQMGSSINRKSNVSFSSNVSPKPSNSAPRQTKPSENEYDNSDYYYYYDDSSSYSSKKTPSRPSNASQSLIKSSGSSQKMPKNSPQPEKTTSKNQENSDSNYSYSDSYSDSNPAPNKEPPKPDNIRSSKSGTVNRNKNNDVQLNNHNIQKNESNKNIITNNSDAATINNNASTNGTYLNSHNTNNSNNNASNFNSNANNNANINNNANNSNANNSNANNNVSNAEKNASLNNNANDNITNQNDNQNFIVPIEKPISPVKGLENPVVYRVLRTNIVSLHGKMTHYQLYQSGRPLLHTKTKSAKSSGVLYVGQGAELHIKQGNYAAAILFANNCKTFSIRKNNEYGEEVMTILYKKGVNGLPRETFIFNPTSYNGLPLKLYSRRPSLDETNNWSLNMQGKFTIKSIKNCVIVDQYDNEFAYVMKIEKSALAIEAHEGFSELMVFALGLSSFLCKI